MDTKISGGCLCGAVRYECDEPPIVGAYCYCSDCRKSSGGAMATLIAVPRDAFRLTKGELRYFESVADRGSGTERGFCVNCGSPIHVKNGTRATVGIAVGSLDDPNLFSPGVCLYVASAPSWAHIPANLPRFLANWEDPAA